MLYFVIEGDVVFVCDSAAVDFFCEMRTGLEPVHQRIVTEWLQRAVHYSPSAHN